MTRNFSELSSFLSFEERFEYLKLGGRVGSDTFGFDRYLNQRFYDSPEWRRARRDVIARDLGCDLGVEGYEIYDKVLVHHMNPISPEDVEERNLDILNPDFLITVSHETHNAIHYGGASPKPILNDRTPGDTKLW